MPNAPNDDANYEDIDNDTVTGDDNSSTLAIDSLQDEIM